MEMLWCQGAQNIGLSKYKLKSVLSAPHDQNVRPSQMDKHHGNSVTIPSNKCIAC